MVQKILVATDLSSRSELAVQRAAQLAGHFQARLTLLHVVDDDLPIDYIEQEMGQADDILNSQAGALGDLPGGRPEVNVLPGDPFRTITELAEERKIDLVVMGAHRKQILKDVFTGTTLERVLRTGRHPVLVVNRPATAEYGSVMLAVDMSDASAHAIHAARSLGLLQDVRLSVLHAFMPIAKDMMHYVGVETEEVTEHVGRTIQEARVELDNFLEECVLAELEYEVMLHEGPPFDVIAKAVDVEQPELLVIGTHGRSGLKRALLGSVCDEVLRRIDRDILAVPPARA